VASVLIWTASKSWTSPDSAERGLVLGTLVVVLVEDCGTNLARNSCRMGPWWRPEPGS
jgi:hypothetical protein